MTTKPVTPAERDLADVLTAITHIWSAIDVLASNIPPEKAKQLALEQAAAKAAITAILNRHAPQSVMFSEDDAGCLTFTMDFPMDEAESVNFGEDNGGPSVALSRPIPPRPPKK